MADTQQQQAPPAPSVNGQAPGPLPAFALPDTGERLLGFGLIAAGALLLIIGWFRATGRPLPGEGHAPPE